MCEMIELNITVKPCYERTHVITDWCYICCANRAVKWGRPY